MVSFGKQVFNQAVPIGRVLEVVWELQRNETWERNEQ